MSGNTLLEHEISSDNISVVIQGPLYRVSKQGDLALHSIASIRKHLPKAEIIISTWENENVKGLNADVIAFSDQPVSFLDANGNENNILKQIVSTRKGIDIANRPYVLKFRANHLLLNANIARVRNYPSNLAETRQQLFKQPVTVTNLFIRNPIKIPMLFHLSDLIQFGRQEDLVNLWSSRLPDAKDIFLPANAHSSIFGNFMGYTSLRQVPEQTIMLTWLEKQGYRIDLPNVCYTNYQLCKLWEMLLIENFLVLDWQRSGIQFPSRFHRSFYTNNSNYTEKDLFAIRHRLAGRFYPLRYLGVLINKYISCWFNFSYLHSVASVLLFALSPKFAKKIRHFYREKFKSKNCSNNNHLSF